MSGIINMIIELFRGAINLLLVMPFKLLYNIFIKLPISVIGGILRAIYNLVIKAPASLINGVIGGLGAKA